MGLALGSVGLKLADFDSLTPAEFDEVYRCWERSHLREPWEQARFLACSFLQPWSKRSLKATDICRFSWDNERQQAQHTEVEPSTRERFEEVCRKAEGIRQ